MAHTEHHVFLSIEGRLLRLSNEFWFAFESGEQPLPAEQNTNPAAAAHRRNANILIVTMLDGQCERVEPITVSLDALGYVEKGDLWSLPPLEQTSGRVLDARDRFMTRHLAHAFEWPVSDALLAEAIRQIEAGATQLRAGDVLSK